MPTHHINNLRRKSGSLEQQVKTLESENSALHSRIDHLALLCQGMWEVIEEKLEIPSETLEKKTHDIDLRDGEFDNSMHSTPLSCSTCHRVSHKRQKICVYCGDELPKRHLFENI